MAACAACGAENREAARFCDSCGASLVAAPARPEHRKTVTVLFADVTGSTTLGERLDTETFRGVLDRYYREARSVIERHGGTVEKFIGDAVMAVFGVPAVHEDDAVRAVRAAAELRDGRGLLNAELERDFGTTLDLRIGVNTGEVVATGRETLVTGDAVNVAARLQSAAHPGEILIGAETLALARDAVVVEPLEPLALKGKQESVPAFRNVAVEPGAPGLARDLDAPMVGRTHELALLENGFAYAVRSRSCALFTLLGTAGVGKSRLTREFLAGVDARVVEARCLSYGEGITYWPVVAIVKALGGVQAVLEDAPGAAPILAGLLGEPALPTTSEEIAWAVRQLLEAAAQERPLIVVLDDIHWAEPTLLDLVEHVADLSRSAPILLLCLARPELLELRAGWGGGKLNATTVLLEPLYGAETAELIERLLGGEELEDDLAARIRTAAEGNPLFVEEMVAMVRASGEREVVVPPTIKALLAARLDQLDPAERTVLERGAVEGQLFHSAAVAALATPPGPVDRQLVGLVRKELVRPDRPQLPVGDAYRFRHLLIRDAAYDALPKVARAELHERFASWLEDRGADLVEQDEIVGYHLEQAYRYRAELGPVDARTEELARRASELLARAGRLARLRSDTTAATRLLSRAADLYEPTRPALLPDLAEMLFETGDLARSLAVLDEALETARSRSDERLAAVASVWRAMVAAHAGEDGASIDRVVEETRLAAGVLGLPGNENELASVLSVGGRHLFYIGRAREAAEMLERARGLALEGRDLHRSRDIVRWEGAAHGYGPTPVSGVRTWFAALPEPLRDVVDRDPSTSILATHMHAYSGEFDEARVAFAAAKQATSELGMTIHGHGSNMFLGILELLAGETEAAAGALREAFDALGAVGEAGYRSTVGTMLADALVRLERLDEADEVLAIVAGLAAPDDCDPQVRRRAVGARILARRGEPAAAEALAREGVALAERTDYVVLHGDALLALAAVQEARGDAAGAEASLQEALGLFEGKQNVVQAAQTRERLTMFRPEQARGIPGP